MDTADLDYDLPMAAIAQRPSVPRDSARLLVDRGPVEQPGHRRVADLPDLLRPDDLLVVNDTKVRPARLRLRKPSGGAVEVLLLDALEGQAWQALVRPARRLAPGTVVTSEDGGLEVEVGGDLGQGRRLVTIRRGDPASHGEVPLPPYIHEPLSDPDRYQTVYARRPASVAAPTAGLHLTPDVLDRCRARGVGVAAVELEIGLDTFRPIVAPIVEAHTIHTEAYAVSDDVLAACRTARRVVAVGTTVVRALESAARRGPGRDRTDLFIRRGYPFALVDVLLTNFHTPRSTLLALVDAFIGPRWRDLYGTALAEGYRFLSFGDAMLLERRFS